MTIEVDYVADVPAGTTATCFIGLVRAADNQWVGEISSKHYFDSASAKSGRRHQRCGRAEPWLVTMDPVLLLNNHYNLWIVFARGAETYCDYRGVAPFFVARQAHVFDRAPVFWQPCADRKHRPRHRGADRTLATDSPISEQTC